MAERERLDAACAEHEIKVRSRERARPTLEYDDIIITRHSGDVCAIGAKSETSRGSTSTSEQLQNPKVPA